MKYFYLVIASLLSSYTFAQELTGRTFTTKNGAIDGFDVVAYFTNRKAVKGVQQYSYIWKDARWYFSSEDHLTLFKENPLKYAPQFGGFCAFGVAKGYKVKIEPDAWEIVDNKLYLNYDLTVQKRWSKDKAGFIEIGTVKWMELMDK